MTVEGDHLRRYESVLPDFEAFWEALQRPLPQTLAVNDQRLGAEALAEGLAGALSPCTAAGTAGRTVSRPWMGTLAP